VPRFSHYRCMAVHVNKTRSSGPPVRMLGHRRVAVSEPSQHGPASDLPTAPQGRQRQESLGPPRTSQTRHAGHPAGGLVSFLMGRMRPP
jgi:hypothetical protein